MPKVMCVSRERIMRMSYKTAFQFASYRTEYDKDDPKQALVWFQYGVWHYLLLEMKSE